jgi:hypothetical protein
MPASDDLTQATSLRHKHRRGCGRLSNTSRGRNFLLRSPIRLSPCPHRCQETPFLRPGPPSLARRGSTRRAQRALPPPSGTTRSSDFCWAIEPSSFRSSTYRPSRAGTQQISWGETLRFRRDHVATTPSATTGIGHRRCGTAHPPRTPYGASLSFATTTHLWPLSDPPSRKPPQRIPKPHWGPPGQFRAAPLPLRCWIPPVRAPGQDSHLRSQRPCPAHPISARSRSLRSSPGKADAIPAPSASSPGSRSNTLQLFWAVLLFVVVDMAISFARDRGRDAGCPTPPAQIPASAANALAEPVKLGETLRVGI